MPKLRDYLECSILELKGQCRERNSNLNNETQGSSSWANQGYTLASL